MKEYRQRLDLRVYGTCSWITEEDYFDKWLDRPSHAFLVIFGNAGTGKTMLLDYIAETFQKGETNLKYPAMTCTFFFDQSSYDQNSALAAIKCLIYQLIHQYRSFANLFKASLDKYTSSTPLHKSLTGLCSTLKEMIQHINSFGQTRVIIIVDSLHECEEKSLGHLLSEFKGIAHECENVKFVFSTQPHHEVTSRLPHSRVSVDLHSKMKHDIELITKSHVEKLAQKNKYDRMTQTLIQNAVIREAGTCALWVDLITKALDSTHSKHQHILLQHINEVPEKLSDVYRHMIDNIKEANHKIAARALTTLLSAFRPLSLIELATIAIIEPGHCKPMEIEAAFEPNRVRRILGPLIRLREGRVDLAHSSLKNYLLRLTTTSTAGSFHLANADRGSKMEQMMAGSDSHDTIATACISYLFWIYLDKDTGGVTKKTLATRSTPSLDERALLRSTLHSRVLKRGNSQDLDSKDFKIEFTVQVFFEYAARYWPFHYARTSKKVANALHNQVMFLLGHKHSSGDKMARTVMSKWTEEYRDFYKDPSASNFPASSELTPFVLAAYFDFTSELESPLRGRIPRLIHTLGDACKWAAKAGHLRALKDILSWRESYEKDMPKQRPGSSSTVRPGLESAMPELDCVGIMVNLLPSPDDVFFESHYNLLKGNHRGRHLNFRKAKLEMFKLLAKKAGSAGVKMTDGDTKGRTILSHIAASGDTEMLQLLFRLVPQRDRDLLLKDKGDNAGLTPVCWALESATRFDTLGNPLDIVKALCRQGNAQIQFEVRDSQGRTPIALASLYGFSDVITHLALSKPDVVDSPDIDGRTPLSLAAESDLGSKVAGALIRTGKVNVESRSNLGLTPLQYAVQRGNLRLIRVLVIEAGAALWEVVAEDPETETPQLKIDVPIASREAVLDEIVGLVREVGVDLRGTRPIHEPQTEDNNRWGGRYTPSVLTIRSDTFSSTQTTSDSFLESLSRQTSRRTDSYESLPAIALWEPKTFRVYHRAMRPEAGVPPPPIAQQANTSSAPTGRSQAYSPLILPPPAGIPLPPAGSRPSRELSRSRARFAKSNPTPSILESRDEENAS